MEENCIFCGIVNKQIPAKIVYEDANCVSFLDVNPRSKGMCIVVPKRHVKEFDEDFELSLKVLQSALIVAEMIKQSLQPKSINFSLIPSESVPHLHVRVYPVYEDQIPLIENRPQQTTEQELNEIAEKIRAARIETKKEVKEEEKPIEHTEEEAYWIRREIDLA